MIFVLSMLAACGGGNSSTPPQNNPVPAVTSVMPTSAPAGGSSFTLTVTGTNFVGSSQVLWNGSSRTTSFQSDPTITAQIQAQDIASSGTATVSVSNPAPGGGTSNAVQFQIANASTTVANLTVIPQQGNDLVWDSTRSKIYVSVPSTAAANANDVVVIDPIAGTAGSSYPAGSEPSALAISDDGQYLYIGINGTGSIQRFALSSFSSDISWNLGRDPFFDQLYIAGDMKVAPGAPHTLAVARYDSNVGPPTAGVLIYDDGVARPNIAPTDDSLNTIQWKPDASEIYSQDTEDSAMAFYTLAVDSTGITQVNTYGARFRFFGKHLHLDSNTADVYSDSGEVLDGSTAWRVGFYPTNADPNINQTLEAVDPALGRVFFLSQIQSGPNSNSFEIDCFDQAHFRKLGSVLIANAVGKPENFIRWGSAGLAFVTNDPEVENSSAGQVYILDGTFVNPNGPNDGSSGTALTTLPNVASVMPPSIPVGAPATQVTITGNGFNPTSSVQCNGQTIPATYDSSTQLEFSLPGSLTASAASVVVTVVNASSGGGTSNSVPIAVDPAPTTGNQISVLNIGGNDIAWNSQQQQLYLSVSSVDPVNGNSIVSVNPTTGSVATPAFLGSEPDRLSVSSDNQLLYAGVDGSTSIAQLLTSSLETANQWHLGADDFDGPFFPLDIKAAPGSPHETAAILATFNEIPEATGGIAIYDDAVARPTIAPGFGMINGEEYDDLAWSGSAATLYSAGGGSFYSLNVSSAGVTLGQNYQFILASQGEGLHFDSGTGLVYTDAGHILNPQTGAVVTTLPASGLAVPDSSLNRIFVLGQTAQESGTSNYSIESFDQTTYAPKSSLEITNVVGDPTGLVRWGQSGLAFATEVQGTVSGLNISSGRLYIINGSFVSAADEPRRPLSQHVHRTWGLKARVAARPK